MRRKRILIGVSSLAVLILVSVGSFFGYQKFHQPLFSDSITSNLTSSLYVFKGDAVNIDKHTIQYDKSIKQLSYVSQFQNVHITVSEQPSPDVFSDVPQYFDKWIASTGAIANFDTQNGKVYLASNPKYGVNTIAIMNSKGTLLFAKPDKNLDVDQWKQFFRNLVLK